MKKRKDLWILVIALVSVLFLVILFVAAKTSKNSVADESQRPIAMDEVTPQKEEEETQGENSLETSDKESISKFSASEFAKKYEGNLPQGYAFEKNIMVNTQRDNRIELNILGENDTSIGMAIVFDTEKAEDKCSQMALTIKEDCAADDVDAILKWYLFNFLDSFTEEKKKAVYDDYLYMFDLGTEELRVYSEENLTVMMCHETEKSDKYYYVLISVE